MLSIEDNTLLTRSGRGTPMGELLRRFWVPVLLAEELPAPDCEPRRVTVMGERLLAFRDTAGRVGLVDPRCAHRGADLWYGRNEEGGLRCVYHGWKFDVDGRCVEMPNAPRDSAYAQRVRITSYPTREWAGIIWAWMGPADRITELPMLEFGLVPASHRFVTKKWQDCNWVQSLEGGLDTAHFSFLHMLIARDEHELRDRLRHAAIGAQAVKNDRVRWVRDDPCPSFEVNDTGAGLVLGGARRADGNDLYWRIAQFMMPFHALAPNAFPGETCHGQTWVPVDDTHCWIFTYSWHPDRPLTGEEIASYRSGHSVHAEVDEHYRPLRGLHNNYLIDREDQRLNSYTGIRGVSEQDAAIQDSQGPVVDRSIEHLTATDLGIVRLRRLLLGAARDLAGGIEPAAASRPRAYAVRSGGWVADRSVPLADVLRERFGHPEGWVGDRYGLAPQEQAA